MATQIIQQRFHLFPFLFRKRRFTPSLLSLVLRGGPVDFLGVHRASCFLGCWRGSRLFGDRFLVFENTASGVSICQMRRCFFVGLY